MLRVVIPVLNEEFILKERSEYFQALSQNAQITFVDGGSKDQTVDLAASFGEVLQSRPGRAYQKNLGARCSAGDLLLFLNIDSHISPDVLSRTEEAFRLGALAGCFTMKIQDPKRVFRLYEWAVNWRARHQSIVDADLGLFIRRDVFEALEGFDRMIIMDDILFSKRLRREYPLTVLEEPIEVSARKWYEQGFVKTLFQYSLAYLQLWTKIPFFRDTYSEDERRQCPSYIRPGAEARQGQDPAYDGS